MKEDELTEEMLHVADRFWDDPQNVINLIDLIFFTGEPEDKVIVS